MYDLAQKSRQEDSQAGRTGNRADKPVTLAAACAVTFLNLPVYGRVCQSMSCSNVCT